MRAAKHPLGNAILLAAEALLALAVLAAFPPHAFPASLQEARDLFDKGRYREAEAMGKELVTGKDARGESETIETAEILDLVGRAVLDPGRSMAPDVLPNARRAVAIRERLLGERDPGVSRSLLVLALLHRDRGELQEAKPLFERALWISETALGPDHPEVADCLEGMGLILMSLADLDGAQTNLERALAIREKTAPDSPETAWTLHCLGGLLSKKFDGGRALALHRRAVDIIERRLGPEHPRMASALLNLGNVWKGAGLREMWERALGIADRTLGPDNPVSAFLCNNLGNLAADRGDWNEVRRLRERKVEILVRLYGNDHPQVGRALSGLSSVYAHEGRLAEAWSLANQAHTSLVRSLGPDHPDLVPSLEGLSEISWRLGNLDEAKRLQERAVAVFERSRGREHGWLSNYLRELADLLYGRGETDEAFETALRAERINRRWCERMIGTSSEEYAFAYAAERPPLHALLLWIAARHGDRIPDAAARTWDVLVRSRALVLEEMTDRYHALARPADGVLARLADRWSSARRKLADLEVRGPQDMPEGDYLNAVREARQEKENAELRLAQASASFRERRARREAGLDEIASSLPASSALLVFVRYDPPAFLRTGYPLRPPAPESAEIAPQYLAFVLRCGSHEPVLVPLGPAADIDERVDSWTREASRAPGPGGELAAWKTGVALREQIWDPLLHALDGAERIFVVADGTLVRVNLAALPAEDRSYLVEKGPLLHFLTAERDLVRVPGSKTPARGLLAMGAPAFNDTSLFTALAPVPGKPARIASLSPVGGRRSACGSFRSMRFEPLPASEREARDLAAIWGASARVLTGPAASEAAFKAQAPGKRVLHLATHGFFLGTECASEVDKTRGVRVERTKPQESSKEKTPPSLLLLSGLALAGANHRESATPEEEDGILTAEEISSLDLSGVQWAVLSACNTALGKVVPTEGVLGLRRAFEVAGVDTVIMSLWEVKDRAAREWMNGLYEARLRRKMGSAESVREADRAVLKARRERGESTHPYYWASFVAAGDWR